MRAKLSASRDDDGFVKAARARRAGLFLVSAITVLAIWLSSVAQAGFRPGLIAYDEYGITNQIVISGGATIATSGGFGYPTWSPNGDTLAFTRDFTVWLADRNGRVFAKLFQPPPINTPAGVATGSPDWSPDGRQIAYLCDSGVVRAGILDPPLNVCVVDVTTGARRVLAASTPQLRIPPTYAAISWSPRGDVIAVDLGVCSPGTPLNMDPPAGTCSARIGLVHVATGAITVLAKGTHPDYSTDGSAIVYLDPTGIDIMSASGAFIRQVVPAAHAHGGVGGQAPEWSPDGKQILFSTATDGAVNGNTDLFSVSVHGGPLTHMTHDPNDDVNASWAPLVTTCTVPKLNGQTLAKAKTLIYLAGCVVGKVTGPKKNRTTRRVVNQKPRAHQNVPTGTKVNIQIR